MPKSPWQAFRTQALILIGSIRSAVALTLCFISLPSIGAADESAAVKDAIRRHSETIAQIRSYHLKIETHSRHLQDLPDASCLRFGPYLVGNGEADGRLVHESTTEIWQAGSRRHWIDRTFFSVGDKGVLDFGEHGSVYNYSIDGLSFRFMSGWDWEHPPAQVPLDIARSFNEVDSVNCSISTVDPGVIEDKSSMDRALMYWDLLPGWSLARVQEACELVELPRPDSSVTRLQVHSIPTPDIFANASMYLGAVIDLDHSHGSLITRFEYGQGESSVVRQARQFRQTESGFWYVSEWESVQMGRRTDLMAIPICDINRQLTEEELQVQFPEGSQVNDSDGQIHIWGADGPQESFSTSDDYLNFQKNKLIKLQHGGQQPISSEKARSETNWVIVANVVLFALIVLFLFLRRGVSREA